MKSAAEFLPRLTEWLQGVANLDYNAETAAVKRALTQMREPENLETLTQLGMAGLLSPLEEANDQVRHFVLAESEAEGDAEAEESEDLPHLREIKEFLAKKVRTMLVILAHYAEKGVEPQTSAMVRCYDRITAANALEKARRREEDGET